MYWKYWSGYHFNNACIIRWASSSCSKCIRASGEILSLPSSSWWEGGHLWGDDCRGDLGGVLLPWAPLPNVLGSNIHDSGCSWVKSLEVKHLELSIMSLLCFLSRQARLSLWSKCSCRHWNLSFSVIVSETLSMLLGVLKVENMLLYQGVDLVLSNLSKLELVSLARLVGV